MANSALFSRKLLLRATFKVLTITAFLWIGYILTAGFFTESGTPKTIPHEFDLSSLNDDSVIYFKVEERELMVIKRQNRYHVYWAQDPIYGCRLELHKAIIKPICIDIQYSINGVSAQTKQKLSPLNHEITSNKTLIVY